LPGLRASTLTPVFGLLGLPRGPISACLSGSRPGSHRHCVEAGPPQRSGSRSCLGCGRGVLGMARGGRGVLQGPSGW